MWNKVCFENLGINIQRMIRMEVMMDIISFDMVKVCIVNLKFVGIEKVWLMV